MSYMSTAWPGLRHSLGVVLAAAILAGAGCSFDVGSSGLECEPEGAQRAGEICRDGYWRLLDDAGSDEQTGLDTGGGDVGDVVPRRDTAPPPDVRVDNDTRQVDAADVRVADDGGLDDGGLDDGGLDDGGLDDGGLDDSGLDDVAADVDPLPDADAADACAPRGAEAICDQLGICSDSVSATDTCSGQERIVDCTPFFDLDEDPQNCGACGNACSANGPHSSASCRAGACRVDCDAGWIDTDPAAGCETECTPSNGGTEICDGQDNDCDGQVDGADAAGARTFYADADGDGYGDPDTSIVACNAPAGYVEPAGDCDDDEASVRPEQTEICDNVDNDCDDSVDEDFNRLGTSCTAGQNACRATGTFVCTDDGQTTECDADPTQPTQEICGDDTDNDCDGDIDEDCDCDYAGTDRGVCGTATRDQNGNCQQPEAYESGPESSCDGLNNDCDYRTDEHLKDYRYPDDDGDGFGHGRIYDRERVCPDDPGFADNNDDCDDDNAMVYPGAPELCDARYTDCNHFYSRTRDDEGGGDQWCRDHGYVDDGDIYCGGPENGVSGVCCEISDDGDTICDFESVCDNGQDEDNNEGTDCEDPDCDGLRCADGKTCQSGSCQPRP